MLKKVFLFPVAVAVLASCSENKTGNETTPVADTVKKEATLLPDNELADFKFRTVVLNIPSPFEVITLLSKSEIAFNKELINSVEKESKYATSGQKALNYGSYVVDLIYLSSNEQFSQVKSYFKTSRNLAQSLDCAEIFDKIAGSRLEKYVDQKDTINKVIDEVFLEMDGYLRSNDRLLTATQILVGSWVESQFITTNVLKDQVRNEKNEAVFTNVSQQGYTVEKLMELLKEFENEKELKPLLQDLKDLDSIYKKAKTSTVEDKVFIAEVNTKLKAAREKIVK